MQIISTFGVIFATKKGLIKRSIPLMLIVLEKR